MKLFTDGGSRGNPGKSACAYFLFSDEDKLLNFGGSFLGTQTNNYAEYNGLIEGLKFAQKNGVKNLNCFLDSELVVKQLNGEYKVSDANIKRLFDTVTALKAEFEHVTFTHVLREKNSFADKLVNVILDNV